jgi:hypothetical protein
MFIWMPKEHLYVLVYLVTVMHSMQAGYMDKAQKYTDKALMQIEKLKSMCLHQSEWVCNVPPTFLGHIKFRIKRPDFRIKEAVGSEIKEDEMGGAYSIHGTEEKCI